MVSIRPAASLASSPWLAPRQACFGLASRVSTQVAIVCLRVLSRVSAQAVKAKVRIGLVTSFTDYNIIHTREDYIEYVNKTLQ